MCLLWVEAARGRAARHAGCGLAGVRVSEACGRATAGLCAAARLEGFLIGVLQCRVGGCMAVRAVC